MKNKVIILLVLLGLMFCINLNKSIPIKENKSDHTLVVNNDISQITGILDSSYENIVNVGIYTTLPISFNVGPKNSVNEGINTNYIKGMIVNKSKVCPYMLDIYIGNLPNNKKSIIIRNHSKLLPKTIVSVDDNNKEWRKDCNIYLNQVNKKLGRT